MNSKIANIKNFFMSKVLGKVVAGLSLYLMIKYTYDKLQMKKHILSVQVNFEFIIGRRYLF